MPRKKEPRVPRKEHESASPEALDWESARVFLQVARHKSFRAASHALRQSVNALRRKLDQLENELGVTLVTRHVDGVRLTEEGTRVLAIVERMEKDVFELVRASSSTGSAPQGQVKLAVTEGLGSFWIAPRIIEFTRRNPRVLVDLRCAMTPADILRLEADVAIQLVRPTQKDVRVVKLGRMHLMFFATKSYFERRGQMKSLADLAKHTFVAQAADNLSTVSDYEKEMGQNAHVGEIAMRSNVSSAHYFGVATGAGIGMLPSYAVALGAPVVPIDLDFRSHHDIWLVYHPDAGRIPRVRRLIDWLIEAFSPQQFPWFADEFVHPRNFPRNTTSLLQTDALRLFTEQKPKR